MIAGTFLFFLSLLAPGWLLLKLFFPNQIQGVAKTSAYAYGLGWGWVTTQLFLGLFWLRWPLGAWFGWLFLAEDLVLLVIYLLVNPNWFKNFQATWTRSRQTINDLKRWAVREKFLLAVILFFVLVALGNALVQPLVTWDSLVNWSLKAKSIIKYGQVIFDSSHSDYWLSLGNANYPWNLSLSFAWLGWLTRGFNDLANNLISYGFYLSSIVLIYAFLKERLERQTALLFTMFAASAELFIFHSFSSYGDLPLAYFGLAGFIWLFTALKQPSRAVWFLAGLFLGLATLTKNEGIFYLLSGLPLIWLAFRGLPLKRLGGRVAIYLVGATLASGSWWLFKLVNDLGVQNTAGGWVWHPESLGQIFRFWLTYGGFNIFWIMLLLILVVNRRSILKQRLLAWSWLYLLLIWLSFLFVYVFSKSYVFAADGTVILRNSLTYFPIAVVLTALTFQGNLLNNQNETAEPVSPAQSLPSWLKLKVSQTAVLANHRKLIKFLMVGTTGAIVDFGLLALLVEVWRWQPLVANVVSFTTAMVSNFLFNKFWTWRDDNPHYKKQFAKFTITSVSGLSINTLLLWVFLAINLHYLVAKVIVSIVVAFWNYKINNWWTFKPKIIK